jgi:repressor LexA
MLAAIAKYIKRHGYAPSVRDCGEAMGICSPNGVCCHLKALEKKGWILRDAKVSRSIRIVE